MWRAVPYDGYRFVTVLLTPCALHLFNRSTPMTKPISKLRQRMIEDMAFRNMSPATQKCYTYAVASFARQHHASPDQLGIEHVRAYRLHLLKRGLKARSINPIVGALRFFFATTLGNKALADQITYARPEDTLPAVLTQEQVLALVHAEPDLMMRTIFITIYAAGLRISEVVRLTTADLNSERMVIHVRQAKGAHLLGLHAGQAACDRRSIVIEHVDVETGIERSLDDVTQSIRSGYGEAVRSDHKDVIFKEVLLACTLSKRDSLGRFTARAVADQLSKVILGKTYDVPQFSYHLKAFCDERRGGSRRIAARNPRCVGEEPASVPRL
jgi:Phage integrase, N-terminal SAM-like domain/Phage integrase family